MKYKSLLILSLITFLFFFGLIVRADSDNNECKCDFDTTTYTAECDCAFACAVFMENGKHCNIVCDGSASNVGKGNPAVFGDPPGYLTEMASIKNYLLSVGFKTFLDQSFAKHALPRLLRSAYIGASFISPETKYEIDSLVENTFSTFGRQIRNSFTDPYGKGFTKEFQAGNVITVSYKTIKLNTPKYNIRLLYVK